METLAREGMAPKPGGAILRGLGRIIGAAGIAYTAGELIAAGIRDLGTIAARDIIVQQEKTILAEQDERRKRCLAEANELQLQFEELLDGKLRDANGNVIGYYKTGCKIIVTSGQCFTETISLSPECYELSDQVVESLWEKVDELFAKFIAARQCYMLAQAAYWYSKIIVQTTLGGINIPTFKFPAGDPNATAFDLQIRLPNTDGLTVRELWVKQCFGASSIAGELVLPQ